MTTLITHNGKPILYPQPHDPDTTIWYIMIWDNALAYQDAAIISSDWVVSPSPSSPPSVGEMFIDSSTSGTETTVNGVTYDKTTAVMLSGGSVGTNYTITNTVITDTGETIQKSFILRCDHQ